MNKLYLIIITNAINTSISNVKSDLGLSNLVPGNEISLFKAQYNGKGICIGKYNDKILIVSQEKVFNFYDKAISSFEKQICDLFPNSEITVLTLYSTVDLYGYAIIEKGVRQRIKSGADNDVYIDYGNKIKEEDDIAKEKIFDDSEMAEMEREYSKNDIKKMVDKEISVRVTSRLLRRYFGKDEKEIDSNFDSIKLVEYQQ